MQLDPSFTNAIIFSQHHRYFGKVMTRGYRLADMLNNPSTEILEIRDVRVSQPMNGKSNEVECQQLMLKKDALLLAIPVGGYEAPSRRMYSFVEKHHYHTHIVVPGYTLDGTIHLPERANAWLLLSQASTELTFMAVTHVTVRFAATDVEPLKTKVVIFQRQSIESVQISERPISQRSLLEAAEELRDPAAVDLAKAVAHTPQTQEPAHAEDVATIPLELVTSREPFRRA